jgi:hypothetical protein
MKCRFYLQTPGANPTRLGPFDFANEAEARAAATARLEASPDVTLVDVWCDQGELFRVERAAASVTAWPARPGPRRLGEPNRGLRRCSSMIQPPDLPGAEPNAPNSPSPLLQPDRGGRPLPAHDGVNDDALSDSAIPPLPPRNEGS